MNIPYDSRENGSRSLLRHWLFDGAIASGGAEAGETVVLKVMRFLGWAAFSFHNRNSRRVWSFDEAQRIDADFLAARCQAASRRGHDIQSNGVRLIRGRSDGLPGVVVDRYADWWRSSQAAGPSVWKSVITRRCWQTGLTRLYERSDASVRVRWSLPETTGWLSGAGDTGITIQ
jgi:23S rRNA (cytosine1962-C5)-methyltransferase